MDQNHKLFFRKSIIGFGLIYTVGSINALAQEDVQTAAQHVLGQFKFAQPKPVSAPVATQQAPAAPVSPPIEATMDQDSVPANAAPVEELPMDANDATADSAADTPDNSDADASAGTGDEGTEEGSMDASA